MHFINVVFPAPLAPKETDDLPLRNLKIAICESNLFLIFLRYVSNLNHFPSSLMILLNVRKASPSGQALIAEW